MDLAIVTGANESIGYKISQKLVELGFKVYGLAHNFDGCHFAHREFIRVECDLTSTEAIHNAYATITKEQGNVFLVVHAAQRLNVNSFEATDIEELEYTLKTGLLGPMVLTRLALPSLMKYHGYIINLTWNGQGLLPAGAASAATQGGLHFLGKALFAELQDTGVKVCNLYPQKNAACDAIGAQQNTINPDQVAEAIAQVLQFKENNCIHELVIRPQGTREEPKIPTAITPLIHGPTAIILPTRDKFPSEPEPIPTPEAKVPDDAVFFDDDDEPEDEDDELDQLLEASRQSLLAQKHRRDNQPKRERGGRNRRNRRRGRDRDRPCNDHTGKNDAAASNQAPAASEQEPSAPTMQPEEKKSPADEQRTNRRRNRNRNRRNRGHAPTAQSNPIDTHTENPVPEESHSVSVRRPAQKPQPTAEAENQTAHSKAIPPLTVQQPAKKKAAKKKAAKKKAAKKTSKPTNSDSESKPQAKKKSAKKKAAKKKTTKQVAEGGDLRE